MAYLTPTQATKLLTDQNNIAGWPPEADAQEALIQQASDRIDAIPFRNTELNLPRYVNGKVAQMDNAVSAPNDAPLMPRDLQVATALLARFYGENEIQPDMALRGVEESIDNALSPFLADLPLLVQNALWAHVSDDVRGTDWFNAQTVRARVTGGGSVTPPPGTGGAATPLAYVEN